MIEFTKKKHEHKGVNMSVSCFHLRDHNFQAFSGYFRWLEVENDEVSSSNNNNMPNEMFLLA